jgi:MFS family permease
MKKINDDGINPISSNFGVKGWIVIIISFLCILLDSSLINDSLNVTIPAFAEIKGWNINLLYLFSTITAWIAVAGAVVWGIVSKKISVRFAWAASLAITAVACFFWGNASSSTVYLICLAVSSVGGMGFAYIANMNVIANWFPKKKGIAMGWVTIGFPLSAAVSANLAGILLGTGGLNRVYLFYGIASAVLCVIVALVIRDYPEQAGAFPDNNHKFEAAEAQKELEIGLEYMRTSTWTPKKLLSTGRVWQIALSLGVMELLSLGIMTNFVPRCTQAGYEMNEILVMLGIAGVIAMFGSIGCGLLDATMGTKRATIITLIIAVIAIIFNLIPTRATMYLSLPFLGVMLGGAANYLVSITNTIWGRYDFPMAYKVLKPMVAAIGALGVSLVGVIGNTFSYAVSYAVLAVLAVIATIIMVSLDDSLIGRN